GASSSTSSRTRSRSPPRSARSPSGAGRPRASSRCGTRARAPRGSASRSPAPSSRATPSSPSPTGPRRRAARARPPSARRAAAHRIDPTGVGPELPLTLGLVDRFTAAGLGAFGPTAAAARLEGSKAFTKELLRHERVPTAFFGVFGDPDDAARYVKEVGAPV